MVDTVSEQSHVSGALGTTDQSFSILLCATQSTMPIRTTPEQRRGEQNAGTVDVAAWTPGEEGLLLAKFSHLLHFSGWDGRKR